MTDTTNARIVEKYFDAFGSRNIEELASLYSDNVSLRDWDTELNGRDNILEANKSFFDSVESLSVEVKDIYLNRSSIAAEITIFINQEPLLVTDIITLNEDGKINSIRAYKG